MKTYQIFLCSSIVEFEQERLILHDYIQKLSKITKAARNTSLILRKCENMDNRLELDGKQNFYNQEIIRSELVVFLFGEKAGAYTLEELDTAADAFGEERGSRICVLCTKDPYHSEEATLKELAGWLDKYRLRFALFSHMDTVKLNILTRLMEQL